MTHNYLTALTKMHRSSHFCFLSQDSEREIRCEPKIGSKGQLLFRNEARRKGQHPEVQQHLPRPPPRRGLVERDTAGQPGAVTVWLHLQLPHMGYQQWPQYQYKAANMLGGSIF